MNETALNLLLQIPLAGVVVFVVILFLRHLKETTVLFMQAIKEQREQHLKSLSEIAESLRLLDNSIDSRLKDMAVTKAIQRRVEKEKNVPDNN